MKNNTNLFGILQLLQSEFSQKCRRQRFLEEFLKKFQSHLDFRDVAHQKLLMTSLSRGLWLFWSIKASSEKKFACPKRKFNRRRQKKILLEKPNITFLKLQNVLIYQYIVKPFSRDLLLLRWWYFDVPIFTLVRVDRAKMMEFSLTLLFLHSSILFWCNLLVSFWGTEVLFR